MIAINMLVDVGCDICFAMLVFISNFAAEKMIHGEIKYEGLSVSSV